MRNPPKTVKLVLSALLISFLSGFIFPGFAANPKPRLFIPIGRLLRNHNEVRLLIDGMRYEAAIVKDDCSGFWLQIPFRELEGKTKITVRIIRTNPQNIFHEENCDVRQWTAPCFLIDSANPDILAQARELTAGCRGNDAKARQILDFVLRRIEFKTFPGMHYQTAAATLRAGYGICVNHSRLFVALCRAAGVPARTISGACLDQKLHSYHHEWVEFYDDNRNWHPLEPTFAAPFNLADLTRLDLLYDIEANPTYPFAKGWETDKVRFPNGDMAVFCPDWTLQKRTGEMSYRVIGNGLPQSLEVEAEFEVAKYLR